MKASKYNYIIPFGEKYIFFNGVTEKFFIVSSDRVEVYKKIIGHPDENKEAFSSFLDKMQTMGFVLTDHIDEMNSVKKKIRSFASASSVLSDGSSYLRMQSPLLVLYSEA